MKLAIKSSGFTLVELAVVILIISVLLAGLLMPLATSVESRKREDTQSRLLEAQDALYGHASALGRLPCPDCKQNTGNCVSATLNDGLEDLAGMVCATEVGNLPWATLGVQQSDGWGRVFTYRVTGTYARPIQNCQASGNCQCANPPTVAFTLCELGTISIGNGNSLSNVAQNIPAIIVSHGKNHYEPTQSANEKENYDAINPVKFGTNNSIFSGNIAGTASVFVNRGYALQNQQIEFDDMMIWLSPFLLKSRLLDAGLLP